MAQPSLSSVHVNRPLTNISVAYVQEAENFIADKVFASIPVDKKSDTYYIWNKNDLLRDEAKPRAPHTESAGSGMGLTTATYNCDVFALHKDISDQERANEDPGISLDRTTVRWLTDRMLQRKENQWVADYFVTGIWGTSQVPGALWDNYTTSDPIDDIEDAIRTVMINTGRRPNALVLGYDVERSLKHHPDIVDRIKYTGGLLDQVATRRALAQLFGLQDVFVSQAITATNNEGETAAYSFTHGKHALLVHRAMNPGINIPSAGYTFKWKGVSDGIGETVGVVRFDMPELRSERIESQMAWDNKLVGADLGYFIESAVS
jgi:hypothetical protein